MIKKKDDQLATTSSDLAVPNYIKKGQARGLEKVEKGDVLIPRIKLLQALSPEVTEEGFRAGQLINSITKEVYAEEIEFIPILFYKSRILWSPIDQGGGMSCFSPDSIMPSNKEVVSSKLNKDITSCSVCKFKDWNGKDKPLCTLYYNLPVLLSTSKTIAVLSFYGSKLKIGKGLVTTAMYNPNELDCFACKYILSVKKESNKSNQSFYNFLVKPNGLVTEAEYIEAEKQFERLSNINIKIDQEKEEDE